MRQLYLVGLAFKCQASYKKNPSIRSAAQYLPNVTSCIGLWPELSNIDFGVFVVTVRHGDPGRAYAIKSSQPEEHQCSGAGSPVPSGQGKDLHSISWIRTLFCSLPLSLTESDCLQGRFRSVCFALYGIQTQSERGGVCMWLMWRNMKELCSACAAERVRTLCTNLGPALKLSVRPFAASPATLACPRGLSV